MYKCVRLSDGPCEKGSCIIAHLMGIVLLISVKSYDIDIMLNSTSRGFISVSIHELRHLKIDDFEITHSKKGATSVFLHDSI